MGQEGLTEPGALIWGGAVPGGSEFGKYVWTWQRAFRLVGGDGLAASQLEKQRGNLEKTGEVATGIAGVGVMVCLGCSLQVQDTNGNEGNPPNTSTPSTV